MPNQFLSDEFGDIEDYFVTDYWLIDNFVGDTLWGWGNQFEGELGTNTPGAFQGRNTPVTTFAGGTTWKQVSAGTQITAAIKTDGTLWTWGKGNVGQLGVNDTTNRNTPVTTFAGGTTWKQVSVGYSYMVAIKTDGSLWSWGQNNLGQLGTNNTTDRSTPVTTFAGGNNWKSVSAGGQHTAAIKTDGTLWTWGRGNEGQLGNNVKFEQRLIPVTTFAGGTTWKSVSLGDQFTAAIKTDGTLWTWGENADPFGTIFGRLGTNDITNRETPVTTFVGGTNWTRVSSGRHHTAAIKTDGTLWVWGRNNEGQLGTNNTITRSTPVTTFAGGNNWKSLNCGHSQTAAIKTDGSLWSWGIPTGDNTGTSRSTPVTTLAGGNNWKQVDAGTHTIAIKSGLNVDLS